jgi:hypothetical protein
LNAAQRTNWGKKSRVYLAPAAGVARVEGGAGKRRRYSTDVVASTRARPPKKIVAVVVVFTRELQNGVPVW